MICSPQLFAARSALVDRNLVQMLLVPCTLKRVELLQSLVEIEGGVETGAEGVDGPLCAWLRVLLLTGKGALF